MKTPFQKYLEGIGTIPFWGISPAIDLQDGGRDRPVCPSTPLSIALVGCGAIRHALLSLSRLKRWPERDVTIVFVDNEPEVIARHLLLLQIVFDPTLGARECAEEFLDVYGNCRLRPKTMEYVCIKASELIDLVTNGIGFLSFLVDLSWLKFLLFPLLGHPNPLWTWESRLFHFDTLETKIANPRLQRKVPYLDLYTLQSRL